MILRPLNRIFPRHSTDICCFLLIAIFIPLTYILEMVVVLPEMHQKWTGFYNFTWLAGLFLLFNLTGNILACMLVDTSIRPALLKPPVDINSRRIWHMCDDCQALVPPRSWHCELCKTCVLKRDHHCKFTGCCIGHHNQRYFIYFLIYLLIGTGYVTAYNSVYIWYLHADTFSNLYTLLKMVCPMLMFTIDWSWQNLVLLVYELNVLGFLIAALLIVYHAPIITRGAVSHEVNKGNKYDLGLKRNLEMVLGKRMYLTWLSPFIRSELPHNGIDWEPTKHL